jgi:hypothetical protein
MWRDLWNLSRSMRRAWVLKDEEEFSLWQGCPWQKRAQHLRRGPELCAVAMLEGGK